MLCLRNYLSFWPWLANHHKLKISQRSLGTADAIKPTDLTQQIRCVCNQLKHQLPWASAESKHTQPHHTEEACLKLQMGVKVQEVKNIFTLAAIRVKNHYYIMH